VILCVLHSCLLVIFGLSVHTSNLAICLLVYRSWGHHVTAHWAYVLSPGIPGISWDPWEFMGSLGSQRIPGISFSWDPWDFMGSLGFHGIPGIGISCDLWDSQAASHRQGAGGRGRQPLGISKISPKTIENPQNPPPPTPHSYPPTWGIWSNRDDRHLPRLFQKTRRGKSPAPWCGIAIQSPVWAYMCVPIAAAFGIPSGPGGRGPGAAIWGSMVETESLQN
jgi:hypothetical protein